MRDHVIAITPLDTGEYASRCFVKNTQDLQTTNMFNDAMKFDGPLEAAQFLIAQLPALQALFPVAVYTIAPQRMYVA